MKRESTQKLVDLTFNRCSKSKGLIAHPFFNGFLNDLRKSTKSVSGNYSGNCYPKGRITTIQDFEVTAKHVPKFLLRSGSKIVLKVDVELKCQVENKNQWLSAYKWKVVVQFWS